MSSEGVEDQDEPEQYRWRAEVCLSCMCTRVTSQELINLVSKIQQEGSGVDIQDRKFHGKKYYHCFVGRELVDWMLVNSVAKSRLAAVELCNRMLQDNLITPAKKSTNF